MNGDLCGFLVKNSLSHTLHSPKIRARNSCIVLIANLIPHCPTTRRHTYVARKQRIPSTKSQIRNIGFGAVITDKEDPRNEPVLLAVLPSEKKSLILILEDGIEKKRPRSLAQNSLHSPKKNRVPQAGVS